MTKIAQSSSIVTKRCDQQKPNLKRLSKKPMSIPKSTDRDAKSPKYCITSGLSGTDRYVLTTQQDEAEKQSHVFSFTKDQDT